MWCSAWDMQFALKVNANCAGLKLPATSRLLSWAPPSPRLRRLPSLQLAHEARLGQEAMGRPFPQTTGGGQLPACTATPSPDKPKPQPIPGAQSVIHS